MPAAIRPKGETRRLIVEYLEKNGPMTRPQIAEAVGIQSGVKTLRKMVKDGQIKLGGFNRSGTQLYMAKSRSINNTTKREPSRNVRELGGVKFKSTSKTSDVRQKGSAQLAEDTKSPQLNASEMTKFRVSIEKELVQLSEFDPTDNEDARKKTLRTIVLRQGQPKFRKKLLEIFSNRCAISGTAFDDVLEAAHIMRYKGKKTNHPQNGILLRADFHTLFDLHLIAIDEDTGKLLVSSDLNGTEYEKYRGKKVRIPEETSRGALKQHRDNCSNLS